MSRPAKEKQRRLSQIRELLKIGPKFTIDIVAETGLSPDSLKNYREVLLRIGDITGQRVPVQGKPPKIRYYITDQGRDRPVYAGEEYINPPKPDNAEWWKFTSVRNANVET
jgi:DNA-binding HxlR family transcriptional regulator